jgi:hypothetical protein
VQYSAVFYAQKDQGKLLEPLIDRMVKELAEHDIHILTVHVKVRGRRDVDGERDGGEMWRDVERWGER